jgi:hypothetical protein
MILAAVFAGLALEMQACLCHTVCPTRSPGWCAISNLKGIEYDHSFYAHIYTYVAIHLTRNQFGSTFVL